MNIRFFVILLGLALFGLVGLQFYWLKMALDTQKERFRQQVHNGLAEVARKLDEREIEYDIFQYASNSQAVDAPKELCVNEDSLQKPKKNLFVAYTPPNYDQNEKMAEMERAKAEAELLRAEQRKKEIIAQKATLNASLLLHKIQRYVKGNIFPKNFYSKNTNTLPKLKERTSHISSPISPITQHKNDFKPKVFMSENKENAEKMDFFVCKNPKPHDCSNDYTNMTNPQTDKKSVAKISEVSKNECQLESLYNPRFVVNFDKNNLNFDMNMEQFGKDMEKWGQDMEKWGQDMEKIADLYDKMPNFEKNMEEFVKQIEKLNFEMVDVEKIIKVRENEIVVFNGKVNHTSKNNKNRKNQTNFKNANYNQPDIRNNKQFQARRKLMRDKRDSIRAMVLKPENFGVIIKANNNNQTYNYQTQHNPKNNQTEQDDCPECEEENIQEQMASIQTPLPTSRPNIPISPIVLPLNHKKISNSQQLTQQKDQIIKHVLENVLENIEETKKTPHQKWETRQKLEDRLRFEVLDSFIKATMHLKGIDIACNFIVERRSSHDIQKLINPKNKNSKNIALTHYPNKEKGDSIHKIFFEKNIQNTQNIIKAGFSVPIFTLQNTGNRYFLHIDFPEQHHFILGNMITMFLSSLLLVAIVIYCFVKAIKTILKQKKMSEMTTDFINNMTHELKTPIATVALACEALQDKDMMDKLPHRRTQFINMIQEENHRLQTQVEKVLHIAKLDKGEFTLQYEEVNLDKIIPEISAQMFLQVESREGTIEVDLQAKNHLLQSDKTHLSHIILNLLDNANKYSPEKPKILIKTEDTPTGGIKISVTDKGQGMTKDQQCKVFNKFYRASTGNIHNVKGFGLGLSYVKTMTEALGGKVEVKSDLGKGSTFSVEFEKKG